MDDSEFAILISRLKAGDDSAVGGLLRGFEGDVRLIVRARLPQSLRNQFDSMDFVQAVWASVLVGPDAAEPAFESPRHFLGYLAGVAQNKVWEEYRRRTRTRKYELAREERMQVRPGGFDETRELAATDPTPSQEAQATDRLKQILKGRTPQEAEAIELRRQGLTFEEIAARTQMHERTVRRLITELREQMEARRWE